MLYDEIESPQEITAGELLDQYQARLAAIANEVGRETLRGAEIDDGVIDAVESRSDGDVTLRDAATILALEEGAPDVETILTEVRNHLLLQMSNAVLNVDVIAGDIELDLSPKEIQAKIEGRHPMTLAEYATLHHYIATEADW